MRNLIFSAIALLMTFIMAGYADINTSWANDIAQVEKLFMNMDSIPESYSINAWINVNNNKCDDAWLKQFSNDVAKAMHIEQPPYRYDVVDDGDQHRINIYDNNKIHVSVGLLNDDAKAQNYIMVNAYGGIEDVRLEDIAQSIEQNLKQYSGDIHMSIALKGYIKGRIGQQKLDELSSGVFKALDAKYVEGVKSEMLSSTTAYSPLIKHHINIGDQKANIQLAVRYNSYNNRTYVWLGMPVITVEY